MEVGIGPGQASAPELLSHVPPIIPLAGVVIALTKQKGFDLWTCVIIFTAALIYYFLFVRPRSDRYWTVSGAVPDTEPAATADTTET